MPKQPAAMHNGQQDRMPNMPASGMLPPEADQGLQPARACGWGEIGTHAKSLVHTRLFAAFRNAWLLPGLERQRTRPYPDSGRCA
ncbi:hypothetical protein ABD76_15480 [Paenibacillus dendritiformis]|uniref:hypothetical protein n=1 Tax=Paenibacillus dendritiformis TaxID=130049 RepID=UPI0018CFBCBF|nr:hypothetical protein [Paenibacillus dendritiformis]MBG9793826.1 hypothetical protein [Paenibacillus dendritiformis]